MFTIRRQDQFTTLLLPNTPHCGIGNGTKSGDGQRVTFQYDAWVVIDDNGLDAKGFVIDNKEFKVFFDDQKSTGISCEMLAYTAARHFFKAATPTRRSAKHIREVCVKIWGLPGVAYAEYKWVRGDGSRKSIIH